MQRLTITGRTLDAFKDKTTICGAVEGCTAALALIIHFLAGRHKPGLTGGFKLSGVAFEGLHALGLLKGVCQRAFDDLEHRRNPSELRESLWHFLELPTKDAIAYFDADPSGQAHLRSLMHEVEHRLVRWATAHRVEHPEPAEGGVCIPFTDTVRVNGEHKQFWRTPWRHLYIDTVRYDKDGKALNEMIAAIARYNILIPTLPETVLASPPNDLPPTLTVPVPIRGLGLTLFDAVEELSHHDEEDASFVSRQLLVILLVHDLYETYPLATHAQHLGQHERSDALQRAHALTGFDLAATDYIARMHSPDHDGVDELEACHQQLAEALHEPNVCKEWTDWFVQEFVHSGRFRISGGASEGTAEALAGEINKTLTWIKDDLLVRLDGVLQMHRQAR